MDNGAAYTYLGSANGLSNGTGDAANTDGTSGMTYDHRFLYPDVDAGTSFGLALTLAFDLNGDGYRDAAIGAFGSDIDGIDRGTVYIYLGSRVGLGPGNDGVQFHQRLIYPEADDAAFFGRFLDW